MRTLQVALLVLCACVLAACATEPVAFKWPGIPVDSMNGSVRAVDVPPLDATSPEGPSLKLHFIDVGHGDCTLVEFPSGKTMLIDAGVSPGRDAWAAGRGEAAAAFVASALHGRAIDVLLISCPSAEQYNLLPVVVGGAGVRKVVLVGDWPEYQAPLVGSCPEAGRECDPVRTPLESWIMEKVPDEGSRVHLSEWDVSPFGFKWSVIDDPWVRVYLLAANERSHHPGGNWRVRTRSAVVMIKLGEFKAMLMGNATSDTELAMLSRVDGESEWLHVDLLRMGSHGNAPSAGLREWLAATMPDAVVLSTAEGALPGASTLDACESYVADTLPMHAIRAQGSGLRWTTAGIWCTGESGTVTIASRGRGWTVATER